MFVVIAPAEPEKGETLRQRLLYRAPWNRVTVEEKSFRGCRYRLLSVRSPKRPPWRKLRALVGTGGRVVVSSQLPMPSGCGIIPFRPALFQVRLAVTAAGQLLERVKPGERAVVGVSDPQGLHPWCCGQLLEKGGMLRVYTQKPGRYEEEAQRLLEETGALVQLTQDPRELRGCVLSVALSAGETQTRIPTMVVAAPDTRTRGQPTITDLTVSGWRRPGDWIPPGVEEEVFLGAVTELGARPPRVELGVDQCRLDGRRARLGDMPVPWPEKRF